MKDFYITNIDGSIDKVVWLALMAFIKKLAGKQIVITVSWFTKRKSDVQLRAYWVLMEQVRDHINNIWGQRGDKGEKFSKDDFDKMFKGLFFFKEVLNVKTPRSIAKKSDCSKEEMREFIDEIIAWCRQREIKAEITSAEMQSLINQYKE